MKNFYSIVLSFVLLTIFSTMGNAQTAACNASVTLSSQAQVDAWPVTHGCALVLGDLTISGSDITHLDSLYSLQDVNSRFFIKNNAVLPDLDGLNNFRSALRVKIQSNPNLTSLNGLTSFASAWDTLLIENNARLESLQGLSHLTSARQLYITENPEVENLEGLENVRGVQEVILFSNPALNTIEALHNLTGAVSIDISNNPALTSLEGLNNITAMEAYLRIRGNTNLTNIDALSSVTRINGFYSQMLIMYNQSLTNLNGLSSLTKLGGQYLSEVVIQGNLVLANVDGLTALTDISSGYRTTFILQDNPQLGMCCGVYRIMENLSSFGGKCTSNCASITISGNTGQCTEMGILTNCIPESEKCHGNIVLNNQTIIDAFPVSRGCTTMTGSLSIGINYGEGIYNVDSLAALTSVENLIITGNSFLENLDGLSHVTHTNDLIISDNGRIKSTGLKSLQQVDGKFHLRNNFQLTELGITSVAAINRNLEIIYNDALKTLKGLSDLTTIGGSLFIESNKLTNLDELSKVTSVGGRLQIRNNNRLTNLDGLSALGSIGNDAGVSINLEHNINLQWCCGLSHVLTDHAFTGSVYIAENSAGCTQQSIIDGGPCCPADSPHPLDKFVFAEQPRGPAPLSTNIIVRDYEPGVTYELRQNTDNASVAGPTTGNTGLFVSNLTVTTEYNVLARNSQTGCRSIMTTYPVLTIIASDSSTCDAVHLQDKDLVAEQDTLSAGEATNIIVLHGDEGVQYILRANTDNREVAGPYPSTVGLYTGSLNETATFNVQAIDEATNCRQQMSELVTVTIVNDPSLADSRLRVYPNPGNGEFNLEVKDDSYAVDYVTVAVTDFSGREVGRQVLMRENQQLKGLVNMRPLRSGSYLLSVTKSDGARMVRRIVVHD